MKSGVSDAFLGMEDAKDSKTEVSGESLKSKDGKNTGPLLFVASSDDKPILVTEETDLAKFAYVAEEIKTYSITPTSFKSRTFGTIKEFGDDFTWYVDEFAYNKSSVLRFGINAARVKWTTKPKSDVSDSGSVHSHSSINSKKYTEADAKKVVSNPLEIVVMQKAVDYLLSNPAKTVLIDIFARENGEVRYKDGLLETHSVVLYKNPVNEGGKKHDILVIDPSNFLFSSHLSNLNGVVKHELLDRLVTLHKSIQIYKAAKGSTVGPQSDQYRDCVDIAVKIAFGLEAMKWVRLVLVQKDIQGLDIIKVLSNLTDIDETIIDALLVSRIKQASDMKIAKTFYDIEGSFYRDLNKVSVMHLTKIYRETLDAFKKTLSNCGQEQYLLKLKELCELKSEFAKKFIGELTDGFKAEEERLQKMVIGVSEGEDIGDSI